jgi:hypothetical protein
MEATLTTQLTLPGTEQKYGAKEAGCWLDCSRGIYIGEEVISIAMDHGFKPENGSDTEADDEFYLDVWQEAEDFMQQFAEDGFYFGCSDWGGDWGLWACEEEL